MSVSGVAQNATFTASVDNDHVAVGDQIQVTFTMNSMSGADNFRPPAFSDFNVLSGPNQSTNMQFVNGAVSSSISYAYVIQARSAGTFTIGPASIDYQGKPLSTQPIKIVVAKGAAPPPGGGAKSAPGANAQDTDLGKQIADNVFLKATVDKVKAYQGEQITVTYKLYYRVNIANYSLSKLPALTGFWSEDLNVPKGSEQSNEVINGKQFRVAILKKAAIFAQRTGTLTIDPMEMDCVIQVQTRRRSNDIFDQFFNDPFFGNVQNVKQQLHSEPVKINVLPLPSENIPDGFGGAVGKYSMESWLDKKEVKAGEAVTLKIKLTGTGNLKLLEAPVIDVSPDIEKYDPKITDNLSNDNNVISGSRTFEYLLIPRNAGEQKIASVPFSYFDPESKSYKSFHTPEFVLTVGKGLGFTSTGTEGISKEDVKLLGEDIRFIKSGGSSLRRHGDRLAGSPTFYVMTASPFVLFIGFVVYMRKRERFLGDVRLVKNRKARKIAQRRLEESKKFLQAKNREEFYTAISRALWGYMSDKLGIPAAELTLERIQASLGERKITPELVSKLTSTIEQCEFARFSPTQNPLELDTMYAQTVDLISTIEEQLR
jgi:hypothetical protein